VGLPPGRGDLQARPALRGALAKKLETKHPKPVANSILANKLARAVYFMLRDGKGFDPKKMAPAK
jgi:hypothetical protein